MSLSMQFRRSPQLASFALKTLSAAVLAATLMASASGAGLGRLTVLSSLGQPLNAEIELTSVGRDEAGNLSAKLASADAFRQANIEFNPALYSVRFAIEQRGARPVIRVTSAQPMNEPFVDMLLELGGTSGRLVREYTFLLDPADLRSAQVAAAVAAAAPSPVKTPRTVAESAPVAPKAAAERAAAEPALSRKPVKPAAGDGPGATDGTAKSYTVKRGDSLARIANQVRANGVSLDQMLVAIYRANPNAFVGENMNRMRTGQILAIPGADAASGIANTEAHGVVVAQAQDFSNYRNKLAQQVATSAPQKVPESTRSASGSIAARVEEQKNAANESRDKLKLSKSGVPAAATAPAKTATGPTAEELIAKDKAMSEANSRVKELEKNVADLQKILELKNKSLAEQQKKAEMTTPAPMVAASVKQADNVKQADKAATPAESKNETTQTATTPEVVAPPIVKAGTATRDVAPVASSPALTGGASTPTASTPTASTTAEVPVVAAKPPASTAAATNSVESSFMDDLMGNAFVLPALGLVLVALGALGIVSSRRKKKNQQFEDSILTDSNLKANSLFGSTGGQSVDTNNSVFNSNFAPSASQLDANEVDPVAEADVYIAYGRDAQAEEILKEALRTQPERHAVRTKLLEIYATRKDTRSFEMMATELYGMTKGVGDDWEHAASMGVALDPDNPLYAGARVHREAASVAAFGASSVAADSFDLESLLATTQHLDLPSSVNTISPSLEHSAHLTEDPAVPFMPESLDSHDALDTSAADDTHDKHDKHSSYDTPALHPKQDAGASLDDGLDFDLVGLTLPEEKLLAPSSPEYKDAHQDLNSLNFDMPERMVTPAPISESEAFQKTADEDHHAASPIVDTSAEAGAGLDYMHKPADDKPMHADASSDHLSPPSDPVVAKPDPLEFDLSGITLDLTPGSATAGAPGPRADLDHESHDTLVLDDESMSSAPEMATKLDLAMAYEEIGDKEGARELLDEVIKGGSGDQVARAKQMMSNLG